MAPYHFIVISFPAQGHLNPNLQLSNRLLRFGARVTFLTSSYARLSSTSEPLKGLTFVEYDDAYDSKLKQGEELIQMVEKMKQAGSEALRQVVSSALDDGCPVTCILYSLLMSWVPAVARELHLPSAFVWIQSAATFNVYYNYNHGFQGVLSELEDKGPSATCEFLGVPFVFKRRDLPPFMFAEQMAELDAESSHARVLVNTFDALEPDTLRSVSAYKLTAVGPLIPSEFIDRKDPSDTGFRADSVHNKSTDAYIEWLDAKPDSSVVYVSFGSVSTLAKHQLEEIGRGLLKFGKPFLWVIREYKENSENKLISCIEELQQLGLIVPWCSQLQVLSHPSLTCFFTHCGWNSTIESLINGVPMVGFPQMYDQFTNAKLVEDYFEVGVRVSSNSDGLVESSEIKRCLEIVMGDVKLKQNAKKWMKLAVEAAKEGGSSDKNLRDFVNGFVEV